MSYLESAGASQLSYVAKLFGWRASAAKKAVEAMVASGTLQRDLTLPTQDGEWIALTGLVYDGKVFGIQ